MTRAQSCFRRKAFSSRCASPRLVTCRGEGHLLLSQQRCFLPREDNGHLAGNPALPGPMSRAPMGQDAVRSTSRWPHFHLPLPAAQPHGVKISASRTLMLCQAMARPIAPEAGTDSCRLYPCFSHLPPLCQMYPTTVLLDSKTSLFGPRGHTHSISGAAPSSVLGDPYAVPARTEPRCPGCSIHSSPLSHHPEPSNTT